MAPSHDMPDVAALGEAPPARRRTSRCPSGSAAYRRQLFTAHRRAAADALALLIDLAAAQNVPAPSGARAVRSIAVERVLAEPWSERRLADAVAHLAAGDVPPPASVSGLRLGTETWYLVNDGCHRSAAARAAGRRRLRARVESAVALQPEHFRLAGETLWRLVPTRGSDLTGTGQVWRQRRTGLDPLTRELLAAAGVRELARGTADATARARPSEDGSVRRSADTDEY